MGVLTVLLERADHLKDKDGFGTFVASSLRLPQLVSQLSFGRCSYVLRKELNEFIDKRLGYNVVPNSKRVVPAPSFLAGKSDPYVSLYLEQVSDERDRFTE